MSDPQEPAGRPGERGAPAVDLHREARALVDAARSEGLTVRLVGGLAALEYCRDPMVCRHHHRDIDLVGRRREIGGLAALLVRLGYDENRHVRLASAGQLAQFFRPCAHVEHGAPLHPDDRIDVYLDTFRLHHQISLARRLPLHEYAVSASDALLVKLQRSSLDESDLEDAVALLRDAGSGTGPGQVDAAYIAGLCARDWGLWHDVRASLGLVATVAADFCATEEDARRVTAAAAELRRRLDGERKSVHWRFRSLFGELLPWQDVVDEREGLRLTARERPEVRLARDAADEPPVSSAC